MPAYILPPPPDVEDPLIKAWLFELYKRNASLVDSDTALTQISDVTIASPVDNEVLAYAAGSSEWVNQTPAEANLISTAGGQTIGGTLTVSDTLTLSIGVNLPTYTTANLADKTHIVNTAATKIQGTMVYNATTNNPVYATGNADTSTWVDGAGSLKHTPA